ESRTCDSLVRAGVSGAGRGRRRSGKQLVELLKCGQRRVIIAQPRIESASDGKLFKEHETVSLEVREESTIGRDVNVITHHDERSESRSSVREEHADRVHPSVRLGIERRVDPMAFRQSPIASIFVYRRSCPCCTFLWGQCLHLSRWSRKPSGLFLSHRT
ncbi:hypothetical protein BGY98DRAFT_1133686, partial [Russula aff. rugulosa BPL654]